MIAFLRRWLGAAWLLAAAVVLVVLLIARPGDDRYSLTSSPDTIQYRLCDLVIEAPPPSGRLTEGAVFIGSRIDAPATADSHRPTMSIRLYDPGEMSAVHLAEDGTVLSEDYASAQHEARMKEILDTARMDPFNPATAPWPYTDAVQWEMGRGRTDAFTYRWPDPGSGLMVSHISGVPAGLKLTGCQSSMTKPPAFGGAGGMTDAEDVHPDDRKAFRNFFDEVAIAGGGKQIPGAGLGR